jgi:hypothetical protein
VAGLLIALSCALFGATLVGCTSAEDSITVRLEEVNGSGISGEVQLEEDANGTRITVTEVHGGEITGARLMPGRCRGGGLDDKYPITPPSGTMSIDFCIVREWSEDNSLAAAFTRRGRFVACGHS